MKLIPIPPEAQRDDLVRRLPQTKKPEDLSGQSFGNFVVVGYAGMIDQYTAWLIACRRNHRRVVRHNTLCRLKSCKRCPMLQRVCVVCIKPFRSHGAALTCSPACRKHRLSDNKRRRQAATAVPQSERACSACNRLFVAGLTETTCSPFCVLVNVRGSGPHKTTKVDWRLVDWKQPDVEISREVCVTRERVAQMRAKIRDVCPTLPLSGERTRKRRKFRVAGRLKKPQSSRWSDDEIKLLGTATDEAVAQRTGRSPVAVYEKRMKRGLAAFKPTSKGARIWTEEDKELFRRYGNTEVARRLGLSRGYVFRVRKLLGIKRNTAT